MEIKKEYFFSYYKPCLTDSEADKVAQLYPVLLKIERGVDENGTFWRRIIVYTKIFNKDNSYATSYITNRLLDNDSSTVTEEFTSLEEAENWVKEQIEKVKERRAKIIEKFKENEKLPETEYFIIK